MAPTGFPLTRKSWKSSTEDVAVQEDTVVRFEAYNRRIYRIKAQVLPHLTGFVYLLLGDFPPTLIDTGSGEGRSSADILEGFDQIRTRFGESFAPQDLERILLTHAHVDHFGGAGALAGYLDAEIWLHPYDSRVVSAHDERADVSNKEFEHFLTTAGVEPERQGAIIREFGFTKGRTRSAPVARLLQDGDMFDGIRVHHTPGHSPGHLCFEVPPFLLVGDLILSRTVTQIWPQSLSPGTGLANHLASLEKLGRVATRLFHDGHQPIALPGHESIITDVPGRIAAIRRNHERRLERVLTHIATSAEPPTIDEITKSLYIGSPLSRSLMALADAAARVEYLQQNARLAVANHEALAAMSQPIYRYACIRK